MVDKHRKYMRTDEVISYYTESYDESNRLTDGFGQLEKAGTEELISRFLPKPPVVVVEILAVGMKPV